MSKYVLSEKAPLGDVLISKATHGIYVVTIDSTGHCVGEVVVCTPGDRAILLTGDDESDWFSTSTAADNKNMRVRPLRVGETIECVE